MNIHIDGVHYFLDVSHVVQRVEMIYNTKKCVNTLLLKNGTKLDIGHRSLLRLGLKALMVPFALPILRAAYQEKQLELDSVIKHEDLLDYCVRHFLRYVAQVERDVTIHVSTQVIDSGVKNIKTISTVSNVSDTRTKSTDLSESTDERDRWGDVLCSGENGYGENTFDQRIDTQETINTAI